MTSIMHQRDEEPDLDKAKVSAKTAIIATTIVAGLVGSYYIGMQSVEGRAAERLDAVQHLVGAVSGRVAVLETQRQSDKESLRRIEDKVDRLLERR